MWYLSQLFGLSVRSVINQVQCQVEAHFEWSTVNMKRKFLHRITSTHFTSQIYDSCYQNAGPYRQQNLIHHHDSSMSWLTLEENRWNTSHFYHWRLYFTIQRLFNIRKYYYTQSVVSTTDVFFDHFSRTSSKFPIF